MILLYLILVGVFGIAILWSTIKVMWVDGNMWRAKAESRTMNYIDQPAQRGNIYSSDGKILATTHNETFVIDLMQKIRQSIQDDTFDSLMTNFMNSYYN